MKRVAYFNIDWQLIVPVLVLILLSLTTLFSLQFSFFRNQAIYFVLSFVVFLFFSQMHYRVAKFYALPIYIISLVLLLALLVLGLETRGATRWIELFGVQIQFSEILKPFLALSFSSFLVEHKFSFRTFFLSLLFFAPIGLLIFLQPDLGTALLYAGVVFFTLFTYGFPFFWFLGGVIGFLLTIPFVWHILHDYQKQRILTFLQPSEDPLGTSYNAIQSVIAVGSGMFFGKGLSEGTQSGLRFLPERHTDFIYATLSEGLGFVGSMIILATFAFLLYRVYSICVNSMDPFCRTFSLCAFFILLIQVFVNIGMNIGILPIVGVPLPFVSYGGSSLLSNFILLGLLSAIHRETQKEKTLEIR